MITLENTILAQYANSPVLMAWLGYLNAEIDTARTMYAPAVQATASFSGNLMVVTGVNWATGANPQGYFVPGQSISGTGLPSGLTVVSVNTGDGLVGTYTVSAWCPTLTGVAITGAQFGTQASMSVLNAFYYQLWNPYTAIGYGLDVWGRKVGVTRKVTVPYTPGLGAYFGFSNQAQTNYTGTVFGNSTGTFGSPFYTGSAVTQVQYLTDNVFRQLILAKARANIYSQSSFYTTLNNATSPTYGWVPLTPNIGGGITPTYAGGCSAMALNAMLNQLLGPSGLNLTEVYVQDNRNMTMTLIFQTALSPLYYAMMTQSGVIPRPAGVQVYLVNGVWTTQDLGFAGTGQEPFGQGPMVDTTDMYATVSQPFTPVL